MADGTRPAYQLPLQSAKSQRLVNMSAASLKPLEIETGAAPVFSIIWLHGLGADCRDFQDLPNMLDLPSALPVRFILPNAPERPITLNGGMVMRGWYDLTGMEIVKQEDAAGLAEATEIVESLVIREVERGHKLWSEVFLRVGRLRCIMASAVMNPWQGSSGFQPICRFRENLLALRLKERSGHLSFLRTASLTRCSCWHSARAVDRSFRTAAVMSPGIPIPCRTP
jgi:hypothetical protein